MLVDRGKRDLYMAGEDITDRVDRVEELEDHFGLRLARMYAEVERDDDGLYWLMVNAEIRSDSGALDENIDVHVDCLDADGRIIESDRHYAMAEDFVLFGTTRVLFSRMAWNPTTLRVYPKRM